MAVVTQKLRLYLFLMQVRRPCLLLPFFRRANVAFDQMAQLPLIMFGRLPIFRQYPALGNVSSHRLLKVSSDADDSLQLFFWIGLLSGFPLLAVA